MHGIQGKVEYPDEAKLRDARSQAQEPQEPRDFGTSLFLGLLSRILTQGGFPPLSMAIRPSDSLLHQR